MISSKEEAEILRLYHVEKWKMGTISTHLKRHYSVVKRVLINYKTYDEERTRKKSKSILDEYESFIN